MENEINISSEQINSVLERFGMSSKICDTTFARAISPVRSTGSGVMVDIKPAWAMDVKVVAVSVMMDIAK